MNPGAVAAGTDIGGKPDPRHEQAGRQHLDGFGIFEVELVALLPAHQRFVEHRDLAGRHLYGRLELQIVEADLLALQCRRCRDVVHRPVRQDGVVGRCIDELDAGAVHPDPADAFLAPHHRIARRPFDDHDDVVALRAPPDGRRVALHRAEQHEFGADEVRADFDALARQCGDDAFRPRIRRRQGRRHGKDQGGHPGELGTSHFVVPTAVVSVNRSAGVATSP